VFEALHDMGDPAGVLTALRGTLVEGGSVLVADELVADEFAGPAISSSAVAAGFATCEKLPIAHDFWQFYRLR
jgi:hypothetical protein